MKLKFFLLFLILMFAGCDFSGNKVETNDPFAKFPWLKQTWKQQTKNGVVFERWLRLNDSTFTGDSYRIAEQDTVILEKLRLEFRKSEYFYVADVPHNPAPVAFRLSTFSDSLAMFDNPEHDFPQMITYHQKAPDTLLVWISGKSADTDEEKRIQFLFTAN